MIIDGRFRPTALANELERLEESVRSYRQKAMLFVGAGFLTVFACAGAASYAVEDIGPGLFVLIFGLVIGGLTSVAVLGTIGRQLDKLKFARGLLDQLFEDLHPAKKLNYYLDLTGYDQSHKRYWSGRSMHGNAKHRYDDRWLRTKFMTVDGTEVIIERRADVKVRKGSIQKEKRRLYVKVKPNPKSFGLPNDMGGLKRMVRQRVKEGFHDPPEQIKVVPELQDGWLKVRIAQWDAPIREAEAFMMVETVLLYLHMGG